jgi:transcriptional regulator with XRE-family HTH domain
MTIAERISMLRKELNLNQEDFGKKINVTRSAISNYEKGLRNVMDRVISDICREFSVNEEWLRNGTEPMFIEPNTFSLDEFLKQKNATDIEIDIIKTYFNMPEDLRNGLIDYFKNNILSNIRNDLAATKEENINSIDYEVEAYRKELEAELKGERLSASEKPKGA